MADAVGTIRVDLFANLAEWSSGLTRAEGQLTRFANNTKKVADGFMKTGKQMSTALTLPLVAFAGFATKAAAEAQDLQGMFNITFGNAAKDATTWAEATGNAMGRSTQTIQKTAIAFSEFFEDFNLGEKATVEFSKTFTKLTADFAEFQNVSQDQAQTVLLKGLAGSARGLKTLGIDISDAALQAKAFKLGIAGVNSELTDQQKVLARAAIIMEGTAKMQGEAARSLGETEHETQAAKEQFQELLVTVGEQLLPVFNQFLKLASGVITAFTGLDKSTQGFLIATAGVVAVAGPALVLIGGLGRGLVFATTATSKLIGLGAAVTGFFSRMLAAQAVGKAIKAFGADCDVASPKVKELGLSVAGAIGWFVALAPVAYKAGEAIASFVGPQQWAVNVQAKILEGNLQKLGLSAEEAAKATKWYFSELAAGRNPTEQQILQSVQFAKSFNAQATNFVDDSKAISAASGDGQDSISAYGDELKKLLAGFGNLDQQSAKSTAELQRIRDQVDPIGAALRDYAANMKLARAAGVDMTQAQKVFGLQTVENIRSVDGFRDALMRLPPELRAVIAAQDDLTKRREAFADAWKRAEEKVASSKDFVAKFKQANKDAADAVTAFGKDLTAEFDPASVFEAQMKRIEAAWKAGAISAEVYEKAKRAAFEETPEGQKELEAIKERGKFVDGLAGAFTDAIDGSRNLGASIRELIVETLKAQVIKPFFTNLFNQVIPGQGQGPTMAGGGFDFGKVLSTVGGFFGFGGTRDKGGDVFPGMSYDIGSGVRERFIPEVKGKIVRDNGGGRSATVNIYAKDPNEFRASKRQTARWAQQKLSAA